jgi:hypothetical protein
VIRFSNPAIVPHSSTGTPVMGCALSDVGVLQPGVAITSLLNIHPGIEYKAIAWHGCGATTQQSLCYSMLAGRQALS